ncbi:MAG: hypothetical protein O7C56_03570, partial [Rickettsia endosymbiont of Ixodes persulcatus]|nr:hypothetical protein [Rickettsia endosymbiont of Ixodes persulcatus]
MTQTKSWPPPLPGKIAFIAVEGAKSDLTPSIQNIDFCEVMQNSFSRFYIYFSNALMRSRFRPSMTPDKFAVL